MTPIQKKRVCLIKEQDGRRTFGLGEGLGDARSFGLETAIAY